MEGHRPSTGQPVTMVTTAASCSTLIEMQKFEQVFAKVKKAARRDYDATWRTDAEDGCFASNSAGGATGTGGAHMEVQSAIGDVFPTQYPLRRNHFPVAMESRAIHPAPPTSIALPRSEVGSTHCSIRTVRPPPCSRSTSSNLFQLPAEVPDWRSYFGNSAVTGQPLFQGPPKIQSPPTESSRDPTERLSLSPEAAFPFLSAAAAPRGVQEERKERNRLAAAKCREKKQEQVRRLERRVNELRTDNSNLERQVAKLQGEVQRLQQICNQHRSTGCSI